MVPSKKKRYSSLSFSASEIPFFFEFFDNFKIAPRLDDGNLVVWVTLHSHSNPLTEGKPGNLGSLRRKFGASARSLLLAGCGCSPGWWRMIPSQDPPAVRLPGLRRGAKQGGVGSDSKCYGQIWSLG